MSSQIPDDVRQMLLETLEAQLAQVRAGTSPGVIFITTGEQGKTVLTGEPALLVFSLECAKTMVVSGALAAAQAQAQQQAAFFATPAAGSA